MMKRYSSVFMERLRALAFYGACFSLLYSSLELVRYICVYIYLLGLPFPSLFHLELAIVAFGPTYFMWTGLQAKLGRH